MERHYGRRQSGAGRAGKTPGYAACRAVRKGTARPAARFRAFTLVEMLFVLAVIALIASLMMPILGHARLDAHRTACANNLHQCALAVNMYLEDYDNVYPTYRADPRSAAHADDLLYWHDHFCRALMPAMGEASWVSLTRSYVMGSHAVSGKPRVSLEPPADTGDVYHCPDDGNQSRAVTSYEFKMELATGLPLSEVRMPSATVMLWEQWAFHNGGTQSEYDRRAQLTVVFGDGHAALLNLSATTSARYGKGPDLHWMPVGPEIPTQYIGLDVP